MNHRIMRGALAVVLFLACGPSVLGESFSFQVRHKHWRAGCTGRLTIDEHGIEYSSAKAEHSRNWSYQDLKRVEIESRRELDLLTYEGRKLRPGAEREFEFDLLDAEITEEVYRLLLTRSARPLLTRVLYGAGTAVFIFPARHRHRLGGCEGELRVEKEQIVYDTQDPDDARIWLYRDIASIGLTDPYSFRITTLDETYTFDLKIAMSPEQYDFLWAKVYRLEELYPGAPGVKPGHNSIRSFRILGR